ncbi:MAG: 50S ribosome-binding GTPase, partial [Kiritimatiellales bacterium]|nr:50S ribosome-binding GTPase [Kiritimatiellales bacterium]
MNNFSIAIAGNPNCGKTALFNALTGSHQQVGNWPGVTVERIEGKYSHNDNHYKVTDLPGIYSFSAYSLDEVVARKHILTERPDLVVNIVDASNIERNLYLTTQLLEMRVPMVLVLNMIDLAKQNGIKVDVDHLSRHLGCPVVPIIATRKKGFDQLLDTIDAAVMARQ